LTALGHGGEQQRVSVSAAFTTASVPTLPPAPVRFSITKDWPSRSASHCPIKPPP